MYKRFRSSVPKEPAEYYKMHQEKYYKNQPLKKLPEVEQHSGNPSENIDYKAMSEKPKGMTYEQMMQF